MAETATLMDALKKAAGPTPLSFEGIGGASMASQGLKSLFPMKDLSVMGLEARSESLHAKLERYNGLLAQADALLNELKADEKETRTYSGRVLAAIGALYGKDSSEYEMAGGTRTSEIKR